VPNLSIERLLRFLNALHASDPDSETRVTHLVSIEQLERLRRGDLDLGVFYDVGPYDGIEFEPLFTGEPIVAFLPNGHRLAHRAVLTPPDLAKEALVTLPRSSNPPLHDGFVDRLQQAGYRFRELRETDGVDTRNLLLSIAAGAGVGLCSTSLNGDDSSIVIRRPIDPPLWMPEIVVGWSTEHSRQPPALLASVREIARQLRDDTSSKPA
jgi:DNA-binding transcriptional LysR family regulator